MALVECHGEQVQECEFGPSDDMSRWMQTAVLDGARPRQHLPYCSLLDAEIVVAKGK
jgi:hypothetical protein